MTPPAGIDPAVYSRALTDVRALRPYGTYQVKPEALPPTEDDRCGTRTGYAAHRRRGERACARCRDANSAYDRRLRETGTSKASA